MPHPVTLFALFALGIVGLSGVAEFFEWSAIDPRPEGARGRTADGIIYAVSLLNAEGIRRIVENLVTNFTGFVPLGTVLVALLGVGVAEHSGLLSAAIRSLVLSVYNSTSRHASWVMALTIVFAGVLSNTASEMGYVVLIPLAGAIYLSLGRHPLAGMAAAFAGVSGGYSANLLIGTIDPLLAGITQEAAQLIDPNYLVHPAVNWYFMVVSTFFISIVGTWVTVKIVEPNLGNYNKGSADKGSAEKDAAESTHIKPITSREKKALLWALTSVLLLSIIAFLSIYPDGAVLRNPETNEILSSPFFRGMVALIFLFFFVPGVVYGVVSGTIKSDRDIIDFMSKSMSSLGLYIVLVFFASQFVAFFSWTQLGPIFAVKGSEVLTALKLTGPLIFVPFIFMCAFVNLMLGSASAQWAVTAPIFVPMLMIVGYSPEVIQAAYRIGDSTTNIITPMMSYFGLILAFASKYDRKIGIGTIISTMLPYSIFFMAGWIVLFYLWVFILGLPVGPGTSTYYP